MILIILVVLVVVVVITILLNVLNSTTNKPANITEKKEQSCLLASCNTKKVGQVKIDLMLFWWQQQQQQAKKYKKSNNLFKLKYNDSWKCNNKMLYVCNCSKNGEKSQIKTKEKTKLKDVIKIYVFPFFFKTLKSFSNYQDF